MSFRDVLRIDVMRRVWYAQIVSLFGDWLALFAVIAVVSFAMHGTPRQIVGVQIAYMLPIVFVGPVAGVFVDRWPLKPTLISSDVVRALLAVLLIPTTNIWHVYLVLAALSCVSAFFGPAQQVTIRTHVPASGLIAANALMQMAFMGSRVIGPGAAGAIVATLGPQVCYGVDVLSFFVSAALIGSVAIRRPAAATAAAESSSNRIHRIWLDIRQGVRFIFGHAAVLFVVLAMAAGLFTIGCFGPLIAIYVRDPLHASARLFGFVSGMVGLGMLAGTQVIRHTAGRQARRRHAWCSRDWPASASVRVILGGLPYGGGAGGDLHHRAGLCRHHGAGADAAAARDAARHDRPGLQHEYLSGVLRADSGSGAVGLSGRPPGRAARVHLLCRRRGCDGRRRPCVPSPAALIAAHYRRTPLEITKTRPEW
jgi:MFS family permease